MVGEGDGAWMGRSQSAPDVRDLAMAADSGVIKESTEIKRVGVRSSDFAPFFLKGIPCLYFASNGPHVFYHEPGDTYYRINPDILADDAKLVLKTVSVWADR